MGARFDEPGRSAARDVPDAASGGVPSIVSNDVPDAASNDVLAARIGADARAKLAAARVGIAGAGGLGSHIAVFLARSGVGRLHVVDFDAVDESNLNRQHYRREHVGMPKVEALARQIAEIDPRVEVVAERLRIEPGSAAAVFAGEEIVCEAFDDPAAKAALASELLARDARTVVVSGNGMAGLGPAEKMGVRRVGGRLFVCGDGTADIADAGALFAPRVALCAAQQALCVLRIILGEEKGVLA